MNCPVCGEEPPHQEDWPVRIWREAEKTDCQVTSWRCTECSTRFYVHPDTEEVLIAE